MARKTACSTERPAWQAWRLAPLGGRCDWAQEWQSVKGTQAGWKAGRRLESLPHNKSLLHSAAGRNQTGVAAVGPPATGSLGGIKIFARGEDFRGSQYRECLLRKRSLEGIRMAALPAERRQVRVALGEGVAPGDYSGTAAIQ